MMMKISSTAFALFLATARNASVSADSSPMAGNQLPGVFVSCPSGEVYQGTQTFFSTCTPYPGHSLVASASEAAVSVSLSDAAADPGLNGWSCYPRGIAECPPGYAVAGLCVGYGPVACTEYCPTPGYIAMQCIPSPIADVPLNSGEWLPMPGPDVWGNGKCNEGSVLCGLCASDNPNDCQGGYTRGKCCKYHMYALLDGHKTKQTATLSHSHQCWIPFN
jgi:hypothetical protein